MYSGMPGCPEVAFDVSYCLGVTDEEALLWMTTLA